MSGEAYHSLKWATIYPEKADGPCGFWKLELKVLLEGITGCLRNSLAMNSTVEPQSPSTDPDEPLNKEFHVELRLAVEDSSLTLKKLFVCVSEECCVLSTLSMNKRETGSSGTTCGLSNSHKCAFFPHLTVSIFFQRIRNNILSHCLKPGTLYFHLTASPDKQVCAEWKHSLFWARFPYQHKQQIELYEELHYPA